MRVPLTLDGIEALKKEVTELKTVSRPNVIEAIAEARSHGDLKENAEYHAAREQQSFIEGRIGELEAKLSNAQVIDVSKLPKNGRVVFGVTVNLSDEDTGNEVKYKIVGDDEADIKKRYISINSPIARALIGKEEGDIALVKAPGGEKEYEILDVQYL